MVQTWSGWKRYPDVHDGGHVEAPMGPGVYEVRHTLTGRVVAFGHAGNVANAIADLKVDGGVSPLARLFGKQPLVSRVNDLEYRTCAAAHPRPNQRIAQPSLVLQFHTAHVGLLNTSFSSAFSECNC